MPALNDRLAWLEAAADRLLPQAPGEFDPLDYLEVSELEALEAAYETPGKAEAMWPALYQRAIGRALIEAGTPEEPPGVQATLEQLAGRLTDQEVDVLEAVYRKLADPKP